VRHAILALAVLSVPSVAASNSDAKIPRAFLGQWGLHLIDCRPSKNTPDNRLAVDTQAIFYPTHGDEPLVGLVRSVKKIDSDQAYVTVENAESGNPNQTFSTSRLVFRLMDRGQRLQLTDNTIGERSRREVYWRCQ